MKLTAEIIKQNWPVSEVRIGDQLKETGASQVTVVHALEGKFICKSAHAWKIPAALDRDLSTFEYLPAQGFSHIPKLLKTRDEQRFAIIEQALVYMLEYIEGQNPEQNSETYAALGKLTTELHNIQNFPFKTDFNPRLIIPDLIKNGEKFKFKDEYIDVLNQIPNFENLSQVLIHTDIAPVNSILKSNGEMILIDWDEVGVGPAVLDLGAPLINQFITEDGILKEDCLQSYYQSYFSLRKITREDLSFIFDAGLFWACMYIGYGDTAKRWERIKWAIGNRGKLESFILKSALGG